MTYEDMGRNILRLMAERNIRTIQELQQKTGVSRVTLSNIINGKSNGSLATIFRICNGLDCEVDEVLKRKKVH